MIALLVFRILVVGQAEASGENVRERWQTLDKSGSSIQARLKGVIL